MKLIVHELLSSLSQTLTPEKNIQVCAVRPHLYVHNFPAGKVKVQIKTADGTVIGSSDEIDISSITEASYFHGYVRFNVGAHLMKNRTYLISVVAGTGYSFSDTSYVGVCADYDLRKYDPAYSPAEGMQAPLDIEVWSLSSR